MESQQQSKTVRRIRRSFAVRKHVRGNAEKPRLSVFRSNKHLYAQLIDDENQVTLFGIGTTSKQLKGDLSKKSKDSAKEIGRRIATEAKKQNIQAVVFDRGFYKYHGIIAELANAARERGIKILRE